MNNLFYLQVAISFIAGGAIIGLLSYVTERVPRSLRGIIMALPSTMLVSFIFIAQVNGIQSLAQSIPGAGYALIGSLVYVLTFLFFALTLEKFHCHIIIKIFFTWLFASLGWIIFPILAQDFPRDDVWMPFAILTIVILLIQPVFLRISNHFPAYEKTQQTTKKEMLFRMLFAGMIIALAVIISKLAGSFWGTVIGASYPASFGSQLMIFQKKYPANFIASVIRVVPIGLFPLVAYAITVSFAYPAFGIWIGTVIAIIVSLATGYIVGQISRKVLHR